MRSNLGSTILRVPVMSVDRGILARHAMFSVGDVKESALIDCVLGSEVFCRAQRSHGARDRAAGFAFAF